MRFSTYDQVQSHSGRVFVLGADGKAVEKSVMLGISDGAMTEVISGEVKTKEKVIVGDEPRWIIKRR